MTSTQKATSPTVPQALDIALHHPLGTEWPPPGLHVAGEPVWGVNEVGEPVLLYVPLAGDPGELEAGQLYWGTLGETYLGVSGWQERAIARILQIATGFAFPGLGWLSAFPLVYVRGRNDDVRWLRTTYRGTLWTTEQFQHKIDFGKPGDDPTTTEAAALVLAEDLANKWATHVANATQMAFFTPDVTYTEVGVVECNLDALIPPGGDNTIEQSYGTQWFMYPGGTAPVGLGASFSLPFECALAVSLQTNHRGASGRGRFYFPPPSRNVMAAHGLYDSTWSTPLGTAVGAFLDAVKADHDLVPVVVSPRRKILNEIVSLSVGQVPDSQRRRRRSQDEARALAWSA